MFISTIAKMATLINGYGYLLSARMKPNFFSRKGELGFVNTIQSTLNFNNHSQQLELDDYFELIGNDKYISQQAYSKARQKIKPEAFEQLFDVTVGEASANQTLTTFNGYTPMAVDGTTLALDNLPELKAFFGCSGAKSSACTARASIACDTLNGIVYDAAIEPYAVGERELAMRHIERTKTLGLHNPLYIFDRGYVSNEILAMLEKNGLNYIMRVRGRWHAKLIESTQSGNWSSFRHKGKTCNVRIIKILLDSGEQEVLFTNLSEFSPEDFKH